MGMLAIDLIIALGLIWVAAFFRLPRLIWSILFALGLILLSALHSFSSTSIIVLTLLYLLVVCFIFLHPLRRRFFIRPLIKNIQKNLPTISETEREALEAGNTWWEKDLFSGNPNWKNLLKFPAPV